MNKAAEMHSVRLPVSIDAIDAAWVTEALATRYPGVTAKEARIGRVLYGTSTKIWLHLVYNELGNELGLPPSMVLKGGFEEHSRGMAFMYENEMRFYRDVAPHLAMNAPACYYAGTDRDRRQSIVLLEDLTLRNVRFLRAQEPLDYHEVAAFLDAQARYHAQWWDSRELKAGGRFAWISRHLGGLGEGGYASRCMQPEIWERENWDNHIEKPHCAAIPRLLHDPERVRNGLLRLGEIHQGAVPTFAHGDTHLGNLYLQADGQPGFMDAQMRRSVWCQDVAYHMVAALDIVDRRQWERALLIHYLDRLHAHGVTPPGFDEAWLA